MKSLRILVLLAFFLNPLFVLAQPEDHPHHEKHYGDVGPFETNEIKLEVIRPHSQVNFTQFTAKIYNKTDDYILVAKHKVSFTSDEMGYGTKFPKEDIDFIEPHGDITRTIKVEGGIGFKVDELHIGFDEVFSRAPVKGQKTSGGEFKMKPDKNSIMMEPFAVTLKKWRYGPKELSADFKIRYRGESIGIVTESNVVIRKEDGTILENTRARSKPFIIPPMATRTVGVIRPFASGALKKGESVYVVWDDALEAAESTPINLKGFTLTHDVEKTQRENK
jgi:hypothetical protein